MTRVPSDASRRAVNAFRSAYRYVLTSAPGARFESVFPEAIKEGVESALRVYFEQIEKATEKLADDPRERAFYMFGYHPD